MKKRNNILTISAAGLMSILVLSCQKDELVAPLQVTNADNNAVVRTIDEAQFLDRATPYTLMGIEDTWDKAYESEEGELTSRTIPTLAGTWKLTTLDQQPIELHLAEAPFIRIGSSLTGFSGCNQITGSVSVNADLVSFQNIADPRKHCPATYEMEWQFVNALRTTVNYTLDIDELRLSNNYGVVATLQRVTNQPPTPVGVDDL